MADNREWAEEGNWIIQIKPPTVTEGGRILGYTKSYKLAFYFWLRHKLWKEGKTLLLCYHHNGSNVIVKKPKPPRMINKLRKKMGLPPIP